MRKIKSLGFCKGWLKSSLRACLFASMLVLGLGALNQIDSADWPSPVTWKPDPRAIKSGLYIQPHAACEKEVVAFTLTETAGVKRSSSFVRGAVPLYRGELSDPSLIRLLDESGKEIPVQAKATAFWPEKSIRFLCLDFLTDIDAKEVKKFTLEYGSKVTGQGGKSLVTGKKTESVSLSTDHLKLNFKLGKEFLQVSIQKPAQSLKPITGRAIICTDEKGKNPKKQPLSIESIEVTEDGPVQTTVHLSGHYGDQKTYIPKKINRQQKKKVDQDAWRYPVSMHFRVYKQNSKIYLEHAFGYNGDEYSEFVYSYGLNIPTGLQGGEFVYGADEGKEAKSTLGVRLNQFAHNVWTLSGTASSKGKRFGGWGGIRQGKSQVSVVMREAWQNWPVAISAEKNGDLTYEMMGEKTGRGLDLRYEPEGYKKNQKGPRIASHSMLTGLTNKLSDDYAPSNSMDHGRARGIVKIHELLIDFSETGESREKISAAFQKPLSPWPGQERFAKTKVLGHIAVYGDKKYENRKNYFSVLLDYYPVVHEKHGLYGWVDWGDSPMVERGLKLMLHGGKGWTNGERGLIAYFYHYAAGGGLRFLDLGRAMVYSTLGMGTEHRGGDHREGTYHRHSQVHWRTETMARQGAYRGWHVYYWLTGNPEVGRLALLVGSDAPAHKRLTDISKEAKPAKFKYGVQNSAVHFLAHYCWMTSGNWRYARAHHTLCQVGLDCATKGMFPDQKYFVSVGEGGKPIYGPLKKQVEFKGYWATYGGDDILLDWASLTGDPVAVDAIIEVAARHKVIDSRHTHLPREALFTGLAILKGDPRAYEYLSLRLKRIKSLNKYKGKVPTGVYKSAEDWLSYGVSCIYGKNGFSIFASFAEESLLAMYGMQTKDK